MKRLTIILTAALIAVPTFIYAQCNTYYTIKKDLEWQMDSFNAKGKKTGSVETKVISYEENSDGFEAVLEVKHTDKKGKEFMQGTYNVVCTDGIITFDMSQFLPSQQMAATGIDEIKVSGENINYPNQLSVGQELNDGKMTMTIGEGLPLKMEFTITDRKVVGQESITTPAGTFECYKVTYTTKFKTIMNVEGQVIEYITEDKGIIKSESYNRNGKLMGYSVLVK